MSWSVRIVVIGSGFGVVESDVLICVVVSNVVIRAVESDVWLRVVVSVVVIRVVVSDVAFCVVDKSLGTTEIKFILINF